MTVKELLLVILVGALANNIALERLMGLAPFLGWSRREDKAVGMGLAGAVVTLLSAAVLWPIQTYVLDAFGLGYLQIMVCVPVILALVYLAEALFKRSGKGSLGLYFPVIALNGAVLGLCLSIGGMGYLEALASALGAGLGFALAMAVLSALLAKVERADVPKAFRGLPVTLLAAFIVSMLLTAFR